MIQPFYRRPCARTLAVLFWLSCGHGLSRGQSVAADTPKNLVTSTAAEGSKPIRRLNLPEIPYNYVDVDWPPHFRTALARFDNTPEANPLTNEGATLGRVLFYDPKLSVNGTKSCASCHKQSLAFTDDAALSVGFEGKAVARNSMSLVNARYYQRGKFFWDERARTLEEQVLMPIENSIEMGHQLGDLCQQIQVDALYPPLFNAAFGSAEVTKEKISRALAQFVRSIVSYRARYDVGRAQVRSVREPFPNFTQQENLGKEMFFGRANCASCHMSNALPFNPHRPDESYDSSRRPPRQTAFFYMSRPAVNGIDADTEDVDQGVGGARGGDLDRGRFKSPSLRNVELTAPYMHDGRFRTLDQVVEHYNWSIKPHPNLDGRLAGFAANGIALPEVEKVALTKFLHTLTDREMIRDTKYSDPFLE